MRTKYSPVQIEELKQNPYINNCSSIYISFTYEAKKKAIYLYEKGFSPKQIFTEFKLPNYIIKSKIPERNLGKWRKIVQMKGIKGLILNKKGRTPGSGKKIDTSLMSPEEYTKFLETEIQYIKKENEVLKGLKKNVPTKAERFEIIYELSRNNCITTLCSIARVTLSGYYAYKTRLESGNIKENREKKDFEVIREIYLKSRKKAGYRSITMKLRQFGRRINHKKVYRLTKKYDCLSQVRRKNPYRKIMQANYQHSTYANILNRKFQIGNPFQKLGTDITYLKFKGNNLYLSVVKDIISGEILSSYVSGSLSMKVIGKTLSQLESYKKSNKIDFTGSIIHSDQGVHYTHPSFSSGIKKMGFIQSMSRRGNCLDNAPTESFFGHLKDEVDISHCSNLDEVKKYINKYIHHYNNTRPQWNKKKMTPVEYRNHLLSQSANQTVSF